MYKVIIFLCALVALGHAEYPGSEEKVEKCKTLVGNLSRILDDYDRELFDTVSIKKYKRLDAFKDEKVSFADLLKLSPEDLSRLTELENREGNQKCMEEYHQLFAGSSYDAVDSATSNCYKNFDDKTYYLFSFRFRLENLVDDIDSDYCQEYNANELKEEYDNSIKGDLKNYPTVSPKYYEEFNHCVNSTFENLAAKRVQLLNLLDECNRPANECSPCK